MIRNYQENTIPKNFQKWGQGHKDIIQQVQKVLHLKNLGSFMNYRASHCGWRVVGQWQWGRGAWEAVKMCREFRRYAKFYGELLKASFSADLV